MKGLKWISVLTFIFGIILIIYGWMHSWNFRANSSAVFYISGLILFIIGISLDEVRKQFHTLENKIYELEEKRKEI